MENSSLTFTVDLEDHRPDPSFPKRYPEIARRLMTFLDERGMRATFFVLGRLAREEPRLIQEIAEAGHEIAYHSAQHLHLTKDNHDNFLAQSRRDIEYIADLIGQALSGYRAPAFSLTPQSGWAVDAIKSLGFKYSSSVMPVANPINGYPGAPRNPFRWPNELLEIPAAVASVGPINLPYLGGIYLRYLPTWVIKMFLKQDRRDESRWLYCHPHDFDHQEKFFQIEGTSFLVSALLWFNRRGTFAKLERLLSSEADRNSPQTFAEKIA
ncbi:MAG: polysaccharide deacetylase family protein, partial [Pseudomonadota bacterium]